jgi:geranylgeranyl pyrophosphate synthase
MDDTDDRREAECLQQEWDNEQEILRSDPAYHEWLDFINRKELTECLS